MLKYRLSVIFLTILSILFFIVFPIFAGEKEKTEFPNQLFGVKIGGIYSFGKDDNPADIGTMPVKKLTGVEEFTGSGINCYFQPLKEYDAFEYIEYKNNSGKIFTQTSFRMYLLPVIPNTIKNTKELKKETLNWEVTLIEWSVETKNVLEAYNWADDFCKTVTADLEVVPFVYSFEDYADSACIFTENDKKIEINSSKGSKIFRLSYDKSVFKEKNEEADAKIRKLRMNDIKPY